MGTSRDRRPRQYYWDGGGGWRQKGGGGLATGQNPPPAPLLPHACLCGPRQTGHPMPVAPWQSTSTPPRHAHPPACPPPPPSFCCHTRPSVPQHGPTPAHRPRAQSPRQTESKGPPHPSCETGRIRQLKGCLASPCTSRHRATSGSTWDVPVTKGAVDVPGCHALTQPPPPPHPFPTITSARAVFFWVSVLN